MSETKKADLSRFQKLEEQHKSKVSEQYPNAFANMMYVKDKSDFAEDTMLSGHAVLGLMEGDTAALLKFLCNAKTDRLPFQLRETLVSMLNGETILQLTTKVAKVQKGSDC